MVQARRHPHVVSGLCGKIAISRCGEIQQSATKRYERHFIKL